MRSDINTTFSSKNMTKKFRQAGITLVELLIAVALGLFLLSGLLYVYLGSKSSYSTHSAVTNVQETLRFGFEYLTFDLRTAGYMGCANIRDTTPQVVANPPLPELALGKSLKGYNDGAGWANPTTITRVSGTDVITISKAADTTAHISANSNGSQFSIESNPQGIKANDVLIITDCRRSDIFRATTVSNSGSPINIAHASNGNTQPAGSSCAPGSGKLVTECSSAGNYKTDAIIAKLEQWTFFIGINARGNPALYRVNTSVLPLTVPNPPALIEELVEGVYDFQLEYGLDTIDDTIFIADSYSATPANWGQVVSVKVTLRARSLDNNAVPDSTTYSYNGANVTDKRHRQELTTLVGLRNLVQ